MAANETPGGGPPGGEATAAEGAAPEPGVPPGWYPDPQAAGRQRYWDGARWTEHIHPPAGQQDPAFTAARAETDSRQWAMFAHLSALIAILLFGLTWLGPLIIYLTKKDDHPFIAENAREALNFNISVFIYGVAGFLITFVLAFVLIGFLLIPVLIALGVGWLVLVIIAGMKANGGESYRYPLTIRMVS